MDLISHKLFQEGGKQIMEEMRHWFLNGETHAIYPEDIPEELDSKDSSEEDDEWDFYYEDDAELEVGFDPYLGCYTDDC